MTCNSVKENVMAESKRLKKPPKEMTIEEASDFWDEHSLFEFDGTEEVDVTFKRTQAARLKTSPESLIEKWITEKTG